MKFSLLANIKLGQVISPTLKYHLLLSSAISVFIQENHAKHIAGIHNTFLINFPITSTSVDQEIINVVSKRKKDRLSVQKLVLLEQNGDL